MSAPAEEFYDVIKDPSQVNNLIDDPKYAEEIERHRKLLQGWLAKGDSGIGEESIGEMEYQAKDHKWGRAVNPEYEVVRNDSDGDGLSDQWERINGRDPSDGRLQFGFDNGGWQTEGWEATDAAMGNIAGRLGFLDFVLPNGKAAIRRTGLELDATKNRGKLIVKLNCAAGVRVTLQNGDEPSQSQTGASSGAQSIAFDTSKWTKSITELAIAFEGEADSVVEIDSITIE